MSIIRRLASAIVIAAILTQAASAPCEAQPPQRSPRDVIEQQPSEPIEEALAACIDQNPSTAGMIGCAGDAEDAWDRELNDVYRRLLRQLPEPARGALREAQRAWIGLRDREFALMGDLRGLLEGTMWGPVMADQRALFVKARVLQLRAYLSLNGDGRP